MNTTLLALLGTVLGCGGDGAAVSYGNMDQVPVATGGTGNAGGAQTTDDPFSTGGGGAPVAAAGTNASAGSVAAGGMDQAGGGDNSQGGSGGIGAPVDEDGDGSPSGVDCDDNDQMTFPGAPEACNGADNNCDGTPDDDCYEMPPAPNCKMAEFQGHQYAFCPALSNLWRQPEARLQCLMLGMELAKIETKEENTFINDNKQAGDTWIGGADVPNPQHEYLDGSPTDGQWRWLVDDTQFFEGKGNDGVPVDGAFAAWGVTAIGQQPNNIIGSYNGGTCRESCTTFRSNSGGLWYDICCNRRNGNAVCESR